MEKVPNPKTSHSKEVLDYIKQHEKFHKQMISFTQGCEKQIMQISRIDKEMAIANREIKKQQKEIERLKYNLSNFFT